MHARRPFSRDPWRSPFSRLSRRLRRPVPVGVAVAATLLVLVLGNLANNRWAREWSLPLSLLATAALIAIVYWAGGRWADVGLARGTLLRGLCWALALIGIVAAGYGLAAALPVTRGLFEDQRQSVLSGGEVALRALVTVPFGTVLLEEVAFRGVLFGLLLRSRGPLAATLVSSGLFGLWHILPSLGLADAKPALGGAFGHSVIGTLVVDAGAVLFTAVAGCLFCALRRRSGSLLAPMGLHWATNALGYVFGFLLR
ncbi:MULTISPECIES: CPBP family intramembrane glutamic endopeptidase [Streptomyces]